MTFNVVSLLDGRDSTSNSWSPFEITPWLPNLSILIYIIIYLYNIEVVFYRQVQLLETNVVNVLSETLAADINPVIVDINCIACFYKY